jgi:ferrochelatase
VTINAPFDAVLLISFGGPRGPKEIRPFLKNVLRGRHVPAERIEGVVHHYELFGGISPITEITMRQAEGLRERLQPHALPVYLGMRNWHPFLDDTLQKMAADGIRRILALILAPHHSYSSCGQYKQNVLQALNASNLAADHLEVTYINGWHTHPKFVEANVDHITSALNTLPSDRRSNARVIFTAHSIPVAMANEATYERDLTESAELIAKQVSTTNWAIVYQSRSGRPQDPWLEPDICDYLRNEKRRGLEALVVSPIGFVADHIEVLYDLDTEAALVAKELDISMARACTANDHPAFLDMMADVIQSTCRRYAKGIPLQISQGTPGPKPELPPPAR